MKKIQVKQNEGVVDTTSVQNIAGEKSFGNPVNFQTTSGGIPSTIIRMHGGWIYWTKNAAVLDFEGNMRIGKHPVTGFPAVQLFSNGAWVDSNF
jgi:hypothetical protein